MTPELLSPAGSKAALRAAVYGGADAVYIGGEVFNARINAANFSLDEIRRSADFCHENGVKLHVTLNTLIYDREMKEALEYAGQLYKSGVDALILADMGLCREIKKNFPDFELHASTQMSGHNAIAAKMLSDIGFSRMVCAREMSAKAIKELCEKSAVGIEMFIHGAICVSHSGQCLMSSLIGGRSGNRGLCAQPCRMQYNGTYPLSIKDMCLAYHIPEILSLGVCSLKIEGRMKDPEYVYGVTSVYRRLLDEKRSASAREIEKLAALFSRSGFTDGYFTGKISGAMNGIRRDEDKQKTRKNQKSVFSNIAKREPIMTSPRSFPNEISMNEYPKQKSDKILTARFYKSDVIPKHHPFDIVYLPLEIYDAEKANGVILPPVIYDSDIARVKRDLSLAKESGAEHVMFGNIGHFEIARESGLKMHGDFRLNAVNHRSASSYIDMGLCDIILSPELNLAQIRDIITKKAVIVYGRIPLMLLEKRLGKNGLSDRRGAYFPIICEGGRDLVFNSQITYMLDRQKELKNAFINDRHFIFTVENQKEIKRVIDSIETGEPMSCGVRRIK